MQLHLHRQTKAKKGKKKQYWITMVARNGKVVLTGETVTRKANALLTMNSIIVETTGWMPGPNNRCALGRCYFDHTKNELVYF